MNALSYFPMAHGNNYSLLFVLHSCNSESAVGIYLCWKKRATDRAMKECSPAELYSKRNVFTFIILLLLAYFELSSRGKLGTQTCYTYLLKY